MPTVLIIFEFLGTTELMMIALVALIIFGPRKLPEIGRTLGRSIADFKRASDDFKRTWEYEVELDSKKPALPDGQESDVVPYAPTESDALLTPITTGTVDPGALAGDGAQPSGDGQTIARASSRAASARESGDAPETVTTKGGETYIAHGSEDDDELNAS